jgi:hypothetical protein
MAHVDIKTVSFHVIDILVILHSSVELSYFRKSIVARHCMTVLYVALVSTPPQKSVLPSRSCHRLQENEKCDFRVDPNGITYVPNFIQSCPTILQLIYANRTTVTDRHG